MTAPDPLGPVLITARDIYDALIRLTETVNRLVDQGVGHADDIRDHEGRLREIEAAQPARRIGRLEDQVKTLESGRWPLPALAALVAIAALVLSALQFTR